jgi:hypothetical protein
MLHARDHGPIAGIALAGALLAVAGLLGGARGVAYLIIIPVLCLPGLPLGFALFGARHPAGWLSGILLGYATTTLVWWSALFLGWPSQAALGAMWFAALLASLAAGRVGGPLCRLPRWTPRASAWLLALLLLAVVLVTPPFARLGSTNHEGSRLYRAYFIADFMWHTALTAELAKHDPRPKNPYLAPEPLHYYWAYFRLPATVSTAGGLDIETVLKLNALATALLLTAAIYMAAWATRPDWPGAIAAAVGLTIVAASLEGAAAVADIVRRGLPLSEVRDLNIDAIAAWAFKGLRVDNLPRTMWYQPQHGFSCALGLIAVAALRGTVPLGPAGHLLIGSALGASIAFSPSIGLACCAVYGSVMLLQGGRRRTIGSSMRALAVVAVPIAAALAWCWLVEVGAGAGGVLHIGFWGPARNATVVSFLLQFGPLLPLIGIAVWSVDRESWTRLWPSAFGVILAVLVMHLVVLTVDLFWAGFRGGNIFFVFAPPLVAQGLIGLWERVSPRAAVGAALLVLAAGLPTTAIDLFNAQDVENLHLSRDAERARGRDVAFDPSREFHWTVVVPRDSLEALEWIREQTPQAAIVQAEPCARGRETWSLIPSLAQRRMATGVPVPLLAQPVYAQRNAQVQGIYAAKDGAAAWETARALGIDYLYVDRVERDAYAGGMTKFDTDARHFEPVFRRGSAAVYAVRR